MNEAFKKWAKTAALMPPAKRPVGLERNPVKTSLTTSTMAVPTKAIRKISRNCTRNHYVVSKLQNH